MRFTDVGFGPLGNAAGMTGLDGALDARGEGGVIDVATRDATIDWPQQWRAPAVLKRGDARVEWRRFNDGARIWLDDGFVDTGHGRARGKVRMLVRPGEPPLMDVSARAEDFDVTQLWRYLQVGRMSAKSVRWLDAAFRAGRVTEAQVSITGPTRGFPYREGQGEFRARYDKSHLVPFGEYVPLRGLLGLFLRSVAGGITPDDVTAGAGPRSMTLAPDGGDGFPVGVPVCYELIFPDLVRRFAVDGAELLLGITNDAWYGRTGAPYQFLAITALRSAETRLWTARAANTGVSAFIDHYWSNRWSTTAGYSLLDMDNTAGQSANAFKRGHYALANLMHYPAPNVMIGGEFQWGQRENNSDDFESDDYRIQFSAKYNFSKTFGGS